jgi:hypothetical protein
MKINPTGLYLEQNDDSADLKAMKYGLRGVWLRSSTVTRPRQIMETEKLVTGGKTGNQL